MIFATDFLEDVRQALDDEGEDWRDDALCLGMDPDIFYPDDGGGDWKEAKDICEACPVRIECLAYALRRKEQYGIWGGYGDAARREIRRELGLRIRRGPTAKDECRYGHPMTEENTYRHPQGARRCRECNRRRSRQSYYRTKAS